MSKIGYRDNNNSSSAVLGDDKIILQDRIQKVCDKIGFDDSNISWFIYDPNVDKTAMERIWVGQYGEDYGYCYPETNEIYISTLSIRSSALDSAMDKLKQSLKVNKFEPDFLVEVILDEITHVQTGANHGDDDYDSQLRKNQKKYYCLELI